MRGETKKQGQLFSYVALEERVPEAHPLRRRKVRPHVACIDRRKIDGVDRRTTRHASYWLSQMKRKLVEQTFGWVKTVGGLRKTRFIGPEKTELAAHFNCAAYNLLRVAKLVPA